MSTLVYDLKSFRTCFIFFSYLSHSVRMAVSAVVNGSEQPSWGVVGSSSWTLLINIVAVGYRESVQYSLKLPESNKNFRMGSGISECRIAGRGGVMYSPLRL